MSHLDVKIPPLGDYKDVPVIEVLVKKGDTVKANDALLTLESDKATMDVPAPAAGTVKELKVKVGDRVGEGAVVVVLEATAGQKAEAPAPPAPAEREKEPGKAPAPAMAAPAPSAKETVEVQIPALGSYKDVPVIELLVKAGDAVRAGESLLTLESDKATMDVPAPTAGVVHSLLVKAGDRVNQGAVVALLHPSGKEGAPPPAVFEPQAAQVPQRAAARPEEPPASRASKAPEEAEGGEALKVTHASPAVRKLARELGVDLARVEGSGPRARILKTDLQRYVKETLATSGASRGGGPLDLLPWPKVDFARFGPLEVRPLSRIKKLASANLSRNWVLIPHVTQHDEADITELEAFREKLNLESKKEGTKVTLLAFLMKACAAALRRFPEVNASLEGEELILKQYYNLGFAADTAQGLVVPVVRGADQKGLLAIARETAELASRAREGKLQLADMQGGTFTISSLGGIGGSYFTPIINAPEVAILGVSRSVTRPVWDGERFAPRLMLPLSLSYDHRVIDGALAARFVTYLGQLLSDLRRAML